MRLFTSEAPRTRVWMQAKLSRLGYLNNHCVPAYNVHTSASTFLEYNNCLSPKNIKTLRYID